ncbi:hypothetical protein SASPL_110854 [Salvia splendens]|uniref:t-SNARE coiled-coil homology domain-containing protein n=1 Tax=Salvia splendens TaxID=180675 RepID=A0A8X9A2T9_SALSN|nr:hypothetical protein SASPL_110854 [Salvia splendens]
MSFEDLESGRALIPLAGARHIEHGRLEPSPLASSGSTPPSRDINASSIASELRETPSTSVIICEFCTVDFCVSFCRKTRLQIRELVKETSAELDRVRQTYKYNEVNDSKKISDAKLTKDYESVLKDFERAQLLAAEKEKAFPHPIANNTRQTSNRASELEISSLNPMQASLVRESNRQVMHMENEIVLNEAIIDEREQGIREIQKEIGEVNEIFRDLAQLVSAQGALIGDISSNIESSHAATGEGANQLAKASKTQRSTSSMTCLMLVIVGIILLIVVVVFVS